MSTLLLKRKVAERIASAALARALEKRKPPLPSDPVVYATEVLGHDLWDVPVAILRALDVPNARVAVKGCHSSGKTHCAAAAVQWWADTQGIAVTTAPTGDQVERLLWGEIRRTRPLARRKLPGTLLTTELKIDAEHYAFGRSTDQGVRFQGLHGNVLVVIDEAPGVQPDILEAIEGIAAGGDVRVLMIGNPTIPSGPFYDAFTSNRSRWTTFSIDAFTTPNLRSLFPDGVEGKRDDELYAVLAALSDADLDANVRPYLTTRKWVKEHYEEWGPNDPRYIARVRATFPLNADVMLIPLLWAERAKRPPVAEDAPITAGIDVAGPGEDETVLVLRRGGEVLKVQAWGQPDPRGPVAAALEEWGGKQKVKLLNVDSAGIGYYFGLHFRDLGYTVRLVNVGAEARNKRRFANLRAELYWRLRTWFEDDDVAGLTDETTIGQLASIHYAHDNRGRVQIEKKEDAKKRGVDSPDRAEALMLAFAWDAPGGDDDASHLPFVQVAWSMG